MIRPSFTCAPKVKNLTEQDTDFTFEGSPPVLDGACVAQYTSSPNLTSDVAIEDLDVLLCAVTARLRLTGGERLAPTREPPQVHDTLGRVQAAVMECVTALEQLQATLKHDLGRRQKLELEVLHAKTALTQARAELVGNQAGERCVRCLTLHHSLTSLQNRRFFRERFDHTPSALGS